MIICRKLAAGLLLLALVPGGCKTYNNMLDAVKIDNSQAVTTAPIVEEPVQPPDLNQRTVTPPRAVTNAAPSIMTLFVFTGPSDKAIGKEQAYKQGFSIRFPLYGERDKNRTELTDSYTELKEKLD